MPVVKLLLSGHERVTAKRLRLLVLVVGAAVGVAGVPLAPFAGAGVSADAQGDPPAGVPERDVAVEDAGAGAEEGATRDTGGCDPLATTVDGPTHGVDARFFRHCGVGPLAPCSGARARSIRGPPVAA